MGYYIDLKDISIQEFRRILKTADLIPSRMILKDNIDENFKIIENLKINNVDELQKVLKNKTKIQAFSKLSGINEDYLKILIREINSYLQKPNKIKDFPNVSEDIVSKLTEIGIKNTFQLYDEILNEIKRTELSNRIEINKDEILKLTKLTDLSRIRWVNHTFAFVLLESGYDTVQKVASCNHKELYNTITKLNEERKIYKGHIGLHDMKLCVEAAGDLALEIEY